jgi:hypothetical protein
MKEPRAMNTAVPKPEEFIKQRLKTGESEPSLLISLMTGEGISETDAKLAIVDMLNQGALQFDWDRKLKLQDQP